FSTAPRCTAGTTRRDGRLREPTSRRSSPSGTGYSARPSSRTRAARRHPTTASPTPSREAIWPSSSAPSGPSGTRSRRPPPPGPPSRTPRLGTLAAPSLPAPVADLGHVDPVLPDVGAVLRELLVELADERLRPFAEPGQAADRVLGEMEPIHVV